VSFAKGPAWAHVIFSQDKLYKNTSLAFSEVDGFWGFYATMQGTVLGVTANTQGITVGSMALQTTARTTAAVPQARVRAAASPVATILSPQLRAKIEEWLGPRALARLPRQ
jgi:hypothetical protein